MTRAKQRFVYEWKSRILFVYANSHQHARQLLDDAGFTNAKFNGKRPLDEEPYVIIDWRYAPGA